jgi:hypothetical protein
MRRRDILAGAGSLAAGATVTMPAPAIAQGVRQLTMVTDWPEGLPGLQASATPSVVNSTSSRSSPAAPVPRWAGGLLVR